jgi:hypothetical protein
VQTLVALRLLEVLRDQDLPAEILQDEDPTVTLPRRFGLSDVVERQIRTFREDERRRHRLSDVEILDLFRLVVRRPDAEVVFRHLGRTLAEPVWWGQWRRLVPMTAALALARGRVRRRLKRLFGRRMGGFGRGGFSIEGRSLLFIDADPGGDACFLMSGLCESILQQVSGRRATVTHSLCQSRGDALCRWEGSLAVDSVPANAPAARIATS